LELQVILPFSPDQPVILPFEYSDLMERSGNGLWQRIFHESKDDLVFGKNIEEWSKSCKNV
jgi:hypothetical protein